MSAIPKYKLDFEMFTCYTINHEYGIILAKSSKIILYPGKTTNKGSLFFESTTLNELEAEKQGQSTINKFINCLIISQNRDKMVPVIFGKIELLNTEAVKRLTRTLHKELTASCTVTAVLPEEGAKEAKRLFLRLGRQTSDHQQILDRAIEWFRKAAEAQDEDCFVYRWIAVESLCALVKDSSSTPRMLNSLVNEYLPIATAEGITELNKETIRQLSEANLEGWHGEKTSQNLEESIKSGESAKVQLCRALLCVYEVRNNLIHKGQKLPVLGGSTHLLRDIIVGVITNKPK